MNSKQFKSSFLDFFISYFRHALNHALKSSEHLYDNTRISQCKSFFHAFCFCFARQFVSNGSNQLIGQSACEAKLPSERPSWADES